MSESPTAVANKPDLFPDWVDKMREIFRAGTVSQYLLYGNVFDLVPYRPASTPEAPDPATRFYSLKEFLSEVLFAKFDVVLYYSRGAGLKPLRGDDHFKKFLQIMDDWTNSKHLGGPLPRDTVAVMELLDRFLRYCQKRTAVENNQAVSAPLRTVVLMDFVQYLVPQADPAHMNDRAVETMIRLLDWANDPSFLGSQLVTVLIAENLSNLCKSLVENSYSAKLQIPLPKAHECREYLGALSVEFPELVSSSDVSLDVMAEKVVGLTRVNLRHMVALAIRNGRSLDSKYLSQIKKELIEKECAGLLEFIESRTSLADVAGLEGAKEWLSQDARLIREGKFSAVPMGYLMTGRIGTGKTWLTHCFAGEVGVPFVAFKNFRDKWMGATEGNLEKIFTVLRALGQVVVFVDEADQMAGKRGGGDGDSGLSGRVYGMLAREMSDTFNRGRIVWVFATSRPDLLEVDLKRPGRLDVHIPLFPPQSDEERRALFLAMARKVGLKLTPEELPDLPANTEIGGNEMEAMMVRAQRVHQLDTGARTMKEILAGVIDEYRPSAHKKNLEYMDLVAVKECTDDKFLPPQFAELTPEALDARIEELKRELRIP